MDKSIIDILADYVNMLVSQRTDWSGDRPLADVLTEYITMLAGAGADLDGDRVNGYWCPPVYYIGRSSPWPRNSMEGSTTIEASDIVKDPEELPLRQAMESSKHMGFHTDVVE